MKSKPNIGSNRDDGASDEPDAQAGRRVPDEIPAALVKKYEHQARVPVAGTRVLRNAPLCQARS